MLLRFEVRGMLSVLWLAEKQKRVSCRCYCCCLILQTLQLVCRVRLSMQWDSRLVRGRRGSRLFGRSKRYWRCGCGRSSIGYYGWSTARLPGRRYPICLFQRVRHSIFHSHFTHVRRYILSVQNPGQADDCHDLSVQV